MSNGSSAAPRRKVPRDPANDYTDGAAAMRRAFACEHSGTPLEHVGRYSLTPGSLPGNIENFYRRRAGADRARGSAHDRGASTPWATSTFRWPTTEGTLVCEL